jgi:hypothetical protein
MLDLNTLVAMPHRWALNVGDSVTGVKGRVSYGWTGQIKAIEQLPDGRLYYQVWWQERAASTDKLVAKHPVVGMVPDQIRRGGE